MSNFLRRRPSNHKPPLPSDFAPSHKETSMLFSVLPTTVQSRLPRVPSFRRTVNTGMYGLTPKRKVSESESGLGSRSTSGSSTPPPAYTSTPTVVLARSEDANTATEVGTSYFTETVQSEQYGLQYGARSKPSGRPQPVMEINDTRSGIAWKSANQGKPTCGYL